MAESTPTPKKAGARLQHVVAHVQEDHLGDCYDEVLVFGQKIDALEYCHGKPGWAYAAVAHGQSFGEALKAAKA